MKKRPLRQRTLRLLLGLTLWLITGVTNYRLFFHLPDALPPNQNFQICIMQGEVPALKTYSALLWHMRRKKWRAAARLDARNQGKRHWWHLSGLVQNHR